MDTLMQLLASELSDCDFKIDKYVDNGIKISCGIGQPWTANLQKQSDPALFDMQQRACQSDII